MQAAFPSPGVVLKDGYQQGAYSGMSLRDYFASHAMQQYIAINFSSRYHTPDDIAKLSYAMATAMIKARGN